MLGKIGLKGSVVQESLIIHRKSDHHHGVILIGKVVLIALYRSKFRKGFGIIGANCCPWGGDYLSSLFSFLLGQIYEILLTDKTFSNFYYPNNRSQKLLWFLLA